jgi:hypothetical protein
VFSFAIVCIILVKIAIDCTSLGVITSSSFFTEAYQNVTERDEDDDSSEYLLDSPELFDEMFGHGPLDIKIQFTNKGVSSVDNENFNDYYNDDTLCKGMKMYLGYNDA